ncbi:MAG: twin-arginine translocase TatA/TatE family subunit [Thermoanaerobaculia bacterium]
MGSLGVPELLVIFVILVLLFGASKIPQLGKGMGEGIRNFKKGLHGTDDEPAETDKKRS